MSFPDIVALLRRYEAQADEEGIFVYSVDKLVLTVNVFQDKGRAWEKLGTTLEEMDAYKGPRARKHPAVGDLYDELLKLLAENRHLFQVPEEA